MHWLLKENVPPNGYELDDFPIRTERVAHVAGHLMSIFYNVLQTVDDGRTDKATKTGGVLTILKEGTSILQLPVGILSTEKWWKYTNISLEKAGRLDYYAHDHHHCHISSWQSRNPDEEHWGGAVITRDKLWTLSFSGLPELADEAFCLMLVYIFGLMTLHRIRKIAAISGSTLYLEPLLTKIRRPN